MLTRELIHTMLLLRRQQHTVFYHLPDELITYIGSFSHDPDPNSDISKALVCAIFSRKNDVITLISMLEKNPYLLLERANVIAPSGDDIRQITIYEALLGAGHFELANEIKLYFDDIKNGKSERLKQYTKYKDHINNITKQPYYDLTPLLNILLKSSPSDDIAILNHDLTHESKLRDAIIQFRKDHKPRILLKPQMHYNYRNLEHAFDLFKSEYIHLFKASGNNYDKINIFWRLIICFEMRRFPGIDRCNISSGLKFFVDNDVLGTYKYGDGKGEFPITLCDDNNKDLGYDYAIDIIQGSIHNAGKNSSIASMLNASEYWKEYIENKMQKSIKIKEVAETKKPEFFIQNVEPEQNHIKRERRIHVNHFRRNKGSF